MLDELELMRREAARKGLLARALGGTVQLLPAPVLVRVRTIHGQAIATTPTHVLHEWVRYGEYHVRWDEKWQVHPVGADEWDGEPLD